MVFSATPNAVADDGEKITIVWMDDQYGEVLENIRMKYVIEPFLAEHPNIEIDWRPITETTKEIRIQMSVSDGPDLLTLDGPTDAFDFLKEGRIIPLNEYAEKYGWNDLIFDWALGTATSPEGQLACIPNSWEGMVLYWNNDILEKEGWQPPKTYDDLLKINEVVRDRGYLTTIQQGTSGNPGFNEWWQSALFGAYAGGKATKDLLTGKIKYTDDPIKGQFERHVEIWNNGVLGNRDTFAITRDDCRAMFTQGMFPFMMEGTWYLSRLLADESGTNWGGGMLPSFREGFEPDFPLAIGSVFCINAAASKEKQDAVAELIDFIFKNEDLHIKAIEAGMQPLPRNIDASKFSDQMPALQKDLLAALNDSMASGKVSFCTWTFFPNDLRTYQKDQFEEVLLGNMTLDDFLAGCQELLDNDLANGSVVPLPDL